MVSSGERKIGTELVPLKIVWRNPLALVQAQLRTRETTSPYYRWAEQAQKDSRMSRQLGRQSSLGCMTRADLRLRELKTHRNRRQTTRHSAKHHPAFAHSRAGDQIRYRVIPDRRKTRAHKALRTSKRPARSDDDMKKRAPSYTRWLLGLVVIAIVFGQQVSRATELKQEALRSWDDYVQAANSQMKDRVASGTFLWVDEDPDRLKHVRAGKILVSPVGPHVPKPVPSGLIHDWIGAAYFPNTTLSDVLAVARDYDHYREYYKPSVVESKSLTLPGGDDRFSMLLVNKEGVAKMALDSEYQACYQKLTEDRWYGVAYTTRIQEIRGYGHSGANKLPPDQGSGYIWRLYSIARFEERDGGIYVEIEAMALSRDIPGGFRWVADPIVRKVSKNSLSTSLQQMQDAVRSTEKDADYAKAHPLPSSGMCGAATNQETHDTARVQRP